MKGVKHHCKPCGKARWGSLKKIRQGIYEFTANGCFHVTTLFLTENKKLSLEP